jgi:hypothetical protein
MKGTFKTTATVVLTAVLVASVAFAANRPRFSGSTFDASDAVAATGWNWTGTQSLANGDASILSGNTLYFDGNSRVQGFQHNGVVLKWVGNTNIAPGSDGLAGFGAAAIRWSDSFFTAIHLGVSGALTDSATAPTISSGFGTSPSVTVGGSTSFRINVGTGGTANSGVIGLPAATNGWNCFCNDVTTASATVFLCKQTATATNSATIGNFNTAGAAAAWVASDIVEVNCRAY